MKKLGIVFVVLFLAVVFRWQWWIAFLLMVGALVIA